MKENTRLCYWKGAVWSYRPRCPGCHSSREKSEVAQVAWLANVVGIPIAAVVVLVAAVVILAHGVRVAALGSILGKNLGSCKDYCNHGYLPNRPSKCPAGDTLEILQEKHLASCRC